MKSLLYKLGGATAILSLTFLLGQQVGRAEGERQRTEVMAELKAKEDALHILNSQLETIHESNQKEINRALEAAKYESDAALAAARSEYAGRLRQSESRAGAYQRMSQADAAERVRLAEHAARLDAALEEGIFVVAELQAALGLRDQQLKQLGQQILADRKLMEAHDERQR